MSNLKMSEEEKQKILDKHKKTIEEENKKKEEQKKGLQVPNKKPNQ